jgi:hypothetical protein
MARHVTIWQNIVLQAEYRCRDPVIIFISDHRCRSSTVELFTDSTIDVGEVAIVTWLADYKRYTILP